MSLFNDVRRVALVAFMLVIAVSNDAHATCASDSDCESGEICNTMTSQCEIIDSPTACDDGVSTCRCNERCVPGARPNTGTCQPVNPGDPNYTCGQVPEMTDYLAVTLLLAGAGFIYYQRRKIKSS